MTCAVSARRARGRRGRDLRLDRQHRRERRRLRGARRAARRGDRARGQDRHRQARPGADARRARDRAARQLRRGARARARARRAPPDRARQLGQRVPARGPEDGGVRDRRRARRARRAVHPGRQRRQHHRLLEGLHRRRARAPRMLGFQAEGAAPLVHGEPVEQPGDGRQRDPDRQPGALGGGDGRDDVLARRDPRGLRRRDPRRLPAAGRAARASSASRPRPPAWPGCSTHGADGAERVVCVLTGHGLKDPQTALDHAGAVVPVRAGASARSSGPCSADAAAPAGPRPGVLGQPRPGLRRARAPRSALHLELEVVETGRFARRTPTSTIAARPAQPGRARRSRRCTRPTTSSSASAPTIPLSGGLGSSAAAIVAGLMAADHMFELDADLLGARHASSRAIRTTSPPRCSAASWSARTAQADALRAARRGSRPCWSCRASRPYGARRARRCPREVPMADAVFNVAPRVAAGARAGDAATRDLVAARARATACTSRAARTCTRARWSWLERARSSARSARRSPAPARPCSCGRSTRAPGPVVRRLEALADGWAEVRRVAFEPQGADVTEL